MSLTETIQEFGVKIGLTFDDKRAEEVHNKIKQLGEELKTLGIEVAAASAAVFGIANAFTSNARSLEDQSQQLGINTTALQEWEYAAKVAANVSRDELVDSMKHLGKFMDEARAGVPEATQALYDIAKAGGKDPNIFLQKLQDRTYKVTDAMKDLGSGLGDLSNVSPQAASRISELAFGTSKLMPMFKLGAQGMDQLTHEADKNFVMNEKVLAQGKAMDVQMTKLWLQFRKLGYEIGFNVMKHIQPLINQFTKWFNANKNLISSGINAFLDQTVEVLKVLLDVSIQVGKALGFFVDMVGGTENAVKALVIAFAAFKGSQIALSIIEVVSAIAKFAGLGEALAALSLIEGIADIGPAFALAAQAIGAALTPILAVVGAITAAVVAIHDIYEIYQQMQSGKSFLESAKNTWTGAAVGKVSKLFGGDSDEDRARNSEPGPGIRQKLLPTLSPKEFSQASPSAAAAIQSTSNIANAGTFNFTNTNNITVPPGTSSTAASKIVTDATVSAHDKIKAKQDAATSRKW